MRTAQDILLGAWGRGGITVKAFSAQLVERTWVFTLAHCYKRYDAALGRLRPSVTQHNASASDSVGGDNKEADLKCCVQKIVSWSGNHSSTRRNKIARLQNMQSIQLATNPEFQINAV